MKGFKTKMPMEEGNNSLKQNLIAGFLAMEPVTHLVDIAKKLGGGSISEEVQYIIQTKCINNKICRNYQIEFVK